MEVVLGSSDGSWCWLLGNRQGATRIILKGKHGPVRLACEAEHGRRDAACPHACSVLQHCSRLSKRLGQPVGDGEAVILRLPPEIKAYFEHV